MSARKRTSDAISGDIASVGRAKKTKSGRQSAWNCFERYERQFDQDIMEELGELEDEDAMGEFIIS